MLPRRAIIIGIEYQCALQFAANFKSTLSKTRRVCVICTNIDPQASVIIVTLF